MYLLIYIHLHMGGVVALKVVEWEKQPKQIRKTGKGFPGHSACCFSHCPLAWSL